MAKYYIDREKLLEDISSAVVFTVRPDRPSAELRGANKIMDRIMVASVADVEEVRHGKRIESGNDYYGLYIVKCSLCREVWCFEVEDAVKLMNYNYCPNCGAKMDGKIGNENGN